MPTILQRTRRRRSSGEEREEEGSDQDLATPPHRLRPATPDDEAPLVSLLAFAARASCLSVQPANSTRRIYERADFTRCAGRLVGDGR